MLDTNIYSWLHEISLTRAKLGETAISPSGALFEAWGNEVHYFGELITLEFQNILGSTFFWVNDKGSGCFMRNKYKIHIKPLYLYLYLTNWWIYNILGWSQESKNSCNLLGLVLNTFNSFPAIKFRGRFSPTILPLNRVRYHVILRVN